MPILKIVKNPNPLLRKKSTEIKKKEITSKEIKRLCLDMAKTMLAKDGVGLAASQIGKNIRLCVINTIVLSKAEGKDGPLCLINPRLTKKSWAREWGEEGCLSVPNIFGEVRRHKKITCKYSNKNGKEVKITAEGLLARVIQHEVDHLEGVLFIDKAKNVKQIRDYRPDRSE